MLSFERGADGSARILLDSGEIGELRRDGMRTILLGEDEVAVFVKHETPKDASQAYPREIVVEGRLADAGVAYRSGYTLLAPDSPLWIEGLGLEVSDDEPGLNREEHEMLRAWLGEQGLPPDTRPFERLHAKDSGRELRVWYEIAGRRKDGRLVRLGEERLGEEETLAAVDSGYRSENGGLKIHHQRPGENGRFRYHRQSLELADQLTGPSGRTLVSHQCGCYGYGIAADYMTLGGSLYHVVADWLDDRVAAEFFLGLRRTGEFPWLGFEGRRRTRDLARRVLSYDLEDAAGALFARVRLDLPDDPPWPDLGAVTYHFERYGADGSLLPLARVERSRERIRLALFGPRSDWEADLEDLDELLAAMPTQVQRGDGIRDSHLGQIEQWIDYVRLLRDPTELRLADAVSDVDALTAIDKVQRLLGRDAERFAATPEALPPSPMGVSVAVSAAR